MRKLFFTFLLVTCNFSFVEAAKSDERKDDRNFNAVFNPEIFSLSKKKENAFDAASATYNLSSEDIRRSGATSIPEVLRLVPGMQVSRIDGNKWAITIRGFDRQFSNKLLVMIDGRTVYTPLFSGVFWDIYDYVLEDIDRIEVIRGPGGTIWGANAVNGIINIITKSAVQTRGTYVSQIVGNRDTSITEARYGGVTTSNDNYRLYVKKSVRKGLEVVGSANDADGTHTGPQENKDGNRQDRAGFKYDISSIESNTISIHGDIFNGVAENYFSTLNNPSKNDKKSRGANLVFNWDRKISKKSNVTLNSYIDYDSFDIPVLKRDSTTFDLDLQHFYNFSKDNQFIWGLGYRQMINEIKTENSVTTSTGSNVTPLNYVRSRNDEMYSAFIQDKFGLVADKLYLTLGSKFLINDFTGFEYQPNARLAYYPTRNQTLWTAVSRAVRTPTIAEDSIDLKSENSNTSLNLGSNTYESEEVMAYEAGYRIKPSYNTLIDTTAFYNDYAKLRTFEGSGTANMNPTSANLGYGESYGFEILGKWQAMNDWRLEASYEYFKMDLHISKNSNDDNTINLASKPAALGAADGLEVAEGLSPKNQIKLKSFYNISSKIEFDNMVYYVDNLPTGGINRRVSGIPSYVRFDTRIGYLPTKNLDLSIGIQNLFDHRHVEFKKALYNRQTEVGRTYYAKLAWQY